MIDLVFSDRQARNEDVRALALEHTERDFGRVPVEMPGERGFVIQVLPAERPSTQDVARGTGLRF